MDLIAITTEFVSFLKSYTVYMYAGEMLICSVP